MDEQASLEAAILRNFLQVQADKHGQQLLEKLPLIAATDMGQSPPAPEARNAANVEEYLPLVAQRGYQISLRQADEDVKGGYCGLQSTGRLDQRGDLQHLLQAVDLTRHGVSCGPHQLEQRDKITLYQQQCVDARQSQIGGDIRRLTNGGRLKFAQGGGDQQPAEHRHHTLLTPRRQPEKTTRERIVLQERYHPYHTAVRHLNPQQPPVPGSLSTTSTMSASLTRVTLARLANNSVSVIKRAAAAPPRRSPSPVSTVPVLSSDSIIVRAPLSSPHDSGFWSSSSNSSCSSFSSPSSESTLGCAPVKIEVKIEPFEAKDEPITVDGCRLTDDAQSRSSASPGIGVVLSPRSETSDDKKLIMTWPCGSLEESKAGPKKQTGSAKDEALHLCAVCGEKAGKHSYYGGRVCPSCRAFFRRSVQSQCHVNFKCINKNQSCEINLLTRKNCQFCRFEKCLASGMRPSWILSEEERLRRFHGRTNKPTKNNEQANGQVVKRVESQLVCPVLNSCNPPPIDTKLSTEDKGWILQYGEVMLRCCTGRHDDLEPNLLGALVQSIQQGADSLQRPTAERLATVIDARTKVCFSLFQEFQSLSHSDQNTILRCNLPLLHRLRQAFCMAMPSLTWRNFISILIGEEKVMEAERQLPCDLSIKPGTSNGSTEYRDLIEHGQSTDVEPFVSTDKTKYSTIISEITEIIDPTDTISLILLVLMTAFTPDFLDLENRTQVESIQLRFVLYLQKHISLSAHLPAKTGLNTSSCYLLKLLMVPSKLRQLAQIPNTHILI